MREQMEEELHHIINNHSIIKYFLKDNGGEEGIRTLESLLSPTPLAGERLRPLGHLSKNRQ